MALRRAGFCLITKTSRKGAFPPALPSIHWYDCISCYLYELVNPEKCCKKMPQITDMWEFKSKDNVMPRKMNKNLYLIYFKRAFPWTNNRFLHWLAPDIKKRAGLSHLSCHAATDPLITGLNVASIIHSYLLANKQINKWWSPLCAHLLDSPFPLFTRCRIKLALHLRCPVTFFICVVS